MYAAEIETNYRGDSTEVKLGHDDSTENQANQVH